MINFRYHLISIVAVFLALAIGIVFGTTVIDRAIVDGLQNRINTVEKNSSQTRSENERLNNELTQSNSQSTVLAGHAVRDNLSNQTVYVMTIGDVSDTTRVEVLELLSVANARKASVVRFSNDFLTSNKTELAAEVSANENIPILLGEETDPDAQLTRTIAYSLSLQAGLPNDLSINAEGILQSLGNNGAFTQEERSNVIEPVQPVSFIVLISRNALENKRTASFVQALYAQFPLTIGLEGNNESTISRNRAIDLLGDQLSEIAVLDNVESPNGRASLLIAHSQNLGGVRQTYGVSSRAQGPAPTLLDQ